jgi:hypothetical protein
MYLKGRMEKFSELEKKVDSRDNALLFFDAKKQSLASLEEKSTSGPKLDEVYNRR